MRLPRIRMTTRRWMVAVAIVGIVLGVTIERHNRFRKIADYHQGEIMKLARRLAAFAGSSDHPLIPRLDSHESMRLKYEHAARYPWLPVEPDPPEPQRIPSGANGG